MLSKAHAGDVEALKDLLQPLRKTLGRDRVKVLAELGFQEASKLPVTDAFLLALGTRK